MKRSASWMVCGLLAVAAWLHAQGPERLQGHSIGSVSTQGNLVVFTLNEGALGKANLFDLTGKTVRFTPDGNGYRVQTGPLAWDAEFGAAATGRVTLKNFAFPFSGRTWDGFTVGTTGSIAFADAAAAGAGGGRGGGGRGGGVNIARFDQLQDAARNLVNSTPALCVFFKPRMSGEHFVKELPDRVVVTWSLTEPYGNIQDFFWKPTVNKFQAVLHKDGSVEMSYQDLSAKDAIVGLYPQVNGGAEKPLATLTGEEHPAVAPHLDIKSIKLASLDGLFLKVTLETRGPALPDGDPGLAGVSYQIYFDGHKPLPAHSLPADATAIWRIRAGGRGGRGGGANRYSAEGVGVGRGVKVEGSQISIQGLLPQGLRAAPSVAVYADVSVSGKTAMEFAPKPVTLTGLREPEVHLSAAKKEDGPYQFPFESFHYMTLPNMHDLACTVIQGLGDKFDMLAYYSDFRIDNQEAGTPSDGPLGGGPGGGAVTGIGAPQEGLANYCTQGRFQWEFIQPVYVGSAQMQEYPPDGITDNNVHNVVTYTHQLAERTSNGKIPPYDYAMSQIGHEMGHRWSAFVTAKVNGETIQLGPTHWARGLQAVAPFPYQRPTEASAMGGGVWQDNFDGTFTQLDDDYYVPATGYSYLDLYLMGLIAPTEVPDFFILRNLQQVGRDPNGHPIFKADRTKVTIADVIAAEGPRLPDVDHAQKKFNTGMVVMVEHGKKPSPELLERTEGIRKAWMDYFLTVTGHRATMTTEVK